MRNFLRTKGGKRNARELFIFRLEQQVQVVIEGSTIQHYKRHNWNNLIGVPA